MLRKPQPRSPQPAAPWEYISLTQAAHSASTLAEPYVEGLIRYSQETPACQAETQAYVAGLETYAASLAERLRARDTGAPLTPDEKDRRIEALETALRAKRSGVRLASRDLVVSDLQFRNRCLTEALQALRAERRKKR